MIYHNYSKTFSHGEHFRAFLSRVDFTRIKTEKF